MHPGHACQHHWPTLAARPTHTQLQLEANDGLLERNVEQIGMLQPLHSMTNLANLANHEFRTCSWKLATALSTADET